MTVLGDMNLSLVFAAIGSGLGTGAAGMAAIGAWKKAYQQNRNAPFLLVAFVGAPLSQVIYGFILRNQILAANWASVSENLSIGWPILIGAVAGIAIGLSVVAQLQCYILSR